MKKIRIPRKVKKYYRDTGVFHFPYVPKAERYIRYFNLENGIKTYKMTAEELCENFGRYLMDDVIWWHWVRWKELGIEPKMSQKYQEYWDFFVKEGVIYEAIY